MKNKKRYVYGAFVGNDRSFKVVKVLVKTGNTIEFQGKSFDINKDDFMLYKNKFIAYLFNENNTKPMNPLNCQVGKFTPEQYTKALRTKIVGELISVLDNRVDSAVIFSIIIMLLVVGVGVLSYITNNNLQVLITDLQSKLNIILGGVQ
jgi:hypothetical protein